MDTLKVEKSVVSLADNSVFWKMKSSKSKGLLNYIYSTDSVLYVIDKLYSYNNTNPLIATEWLKAFPQDSVNKFSFISDIGYKETIVKLNNKVTVPAGSYMNCIKNTKSTNGAEEIIFKPELGIVKFTKYSPYSNPFNPLPSDRRQVSELVKYHFQ
jgi:autonomous glycyl radical cofactor GrcA